MCAAAIGLLGVDGGLLWIVAGVWAARSAAGTPLGLAWGIACLGAGMRWGTLSLGDLAVATRVAGPTLVAGPGAVRAGMALAAAAAIVGEAQAGGFRSRGWGGRAADALVASTLAPLFVVGGPADEVVTDAVVWAAATVAATAVILLLGRRPTGFVPRWVPAVAAAAGVAASIGAS